jgi:hypothetical protein
MSRVTLEIGSVRLNFDSDTDLTRMMGDLAHSMTDKEMCALADVSERTLTRWKLSPSFPRSVSGRITRLQFLEYLFRQKPR